MVNKRKWYSPLINLFWRLYCRIFGHTDDDGVCINCGANLGVDDG